jgi:hypothetical protein
MFLPAAAALQLPGGVHAKAVAVQQHAPQQLRIVGGMAVPVVTVDAVERREVELVDDVEDVEDEPGEILLGEPVAQVRKQQERLVAVGMQEE